MQCGEAGQEAHHVVAGVVTCALDESCIAPAGATTSNHAFDQVVLSVHLHEAGILPSNDWRWMAHDEHFYSEARPYRMPLANNLGSFKEVTPRPADATLYTQRREGPYAEAIRRKC